MNKPKVSVVMSVYNGDRYIKGAVDNILGQDFKDFEFIIINDGSTDDTGQILESYDDPRLRVLNQDNQGLVASLNRGIKEAKAPLIARQDADDISLPTRLEKQYELMQTNRDLVIVGSSIVTIDMNSNALNKHYVLLNDPELKQELLVRSPFAHGAVMFRKDAFEKAGGYLEEEHPAEDYGLWLRIAPFGSFTNIDAPLYQYRENTAGISRLNDSAQTKAKQSIQVRAWTDRKELLPGWIDIRPYENLEMGPDRIERIAANLLFTLRKSIAHVDFRIAWKSLILVFSNKQLRRKCARLTLIKLRLKHA